MRGRLTVVASVVCLSIVTVLPAADRAPEPTKDPQTAKNLEMAEDLEIMGAVVRTALREVYAWPEPCRGAKVSPLLGTWGGASCAQCHAAHPATLRLQRPEGAYLDGYGAVYQMELDAPPPEEKRADPSATEDQHRRGPAAWESAIDRLRGDPTLQPSQKAEVAERTYRMPTKDNLVEKLLDVLADNAGNFRHLKPQDRLSVAITFPRCKAAGELGYNINSNLPVVTLNDGVVHAGTLDPRNSHEVYGDLHMRQGNYQRAIKEYEAWFGDPPMRKPPGEARRYYLKLAQAYTGAGELDTAQKTIALAMRYRKPEAGNASAPASRAIPLPARLIVSVPKARLDEVAARKMKREELNQHATVDYFNPPADRPGLGSPKARPSSGYPRSFRSYGSAGGYQECYGPPASGRGSKPRVNR